jgi:hypothetical protein
VKDQAGKGNASFDCQRSIARSSSRKLRKIIHGLPLQPQATS